VRRVGWNVTAESARVRENQHLFLIGPAGVGKTWLARAFAQKACRDGYTALFLKAAEQFRDLAQARAFRIHRLRGGILEWKLAPRLGRRSPGPRRSPQNRPTINRRPGRKLGREGDTLRPVGNVLNETKKHQIIALGRLGWPLRRIPKSTGVRRETAAVI
jgi:GTPase SAR1 family protein